MHDPRIKNRLLSTCCPLLATLMLAGCATTKTSNTPRTATEQLLISDAIDRAMSNVKFEDFRGYRVFVDDKYLEGVDKGYLMASIRHRVLTGGGAMAPSVD
jgi:hypothetical protein